MKHLKNLVNITKTEDEERRFIEITSKLTLTDLTLDQLDRLRTTANNKYTTDNNRNFK
jgi:hypothetical protein